MSSGSSLTPRVVAGLAWLAFGSTLFGIWCRTGSGVSLMGRPTSSVVVERFGVDYKLTGIGSFVVYGIGIGFAVFGRHPRVGAALVVLAALLTTFRVVVGDHQSYGSEELSLRPGLALLAASGLAWAGALALVFDCRRR